MLLSRKESKIVAARVALILQESDTRACRIILDFFRLFEEEWITGKVFEAQAAHAAKTLLRSDGQPRTLGGCFFWLVKQQMTQEQREEFFPSWKSLKEQKKKQKQQALTRTPTSTPKTTHPRIRRSLVKIIPTDPSRVFRSEPF